MEHEIEPGMAVVGADGLEVGVVARIEGEDLVLTGDATGETRVKRAQVEAVLDVVRLREKAREAADLETGEAPLTGAQS